MLVTSLYTAVSQLDIKTGSGSGPMNPQISFGNIRKKHLTKLIKTKKPKHSLPNQTIKKRKSGAFIP
jgi:hypothetical protein